MHTTILVNETIFFYLQTTATSCVISLTQMSPRLYNRLQLYVRDTIHQNNIKMNRFWEKNCQSL